uniref:Particle-associated lyase n=2 Tax=unclassified bacterial viruses TaxID=12333 RepID=A0AAU6VZU1_9VIRU
MAYDGFYSDLSTRGTVNDILNAANATKDQISVIAAAVKVDAGRAALSATQAQEYAYQAQKAAAAAGGGGSNVEALGVFNGQIYGIVGGSEDMSSAMIRGLQAVREAGGGVLVCRAQEGQVLKIDNAVNIESNDTTMIFESPIEFGPLGYVRFNGRLAELYRPGQSEAGKLSANTYARASDGRMVLPMNPLSVLYYQVGDRITLRGQNDKNGAALQKQVTSIIEINGNEIVCADEPDYTFQPTYPNSQWPPDLTTGTTVIASVYSYMTADSVTRTDTVTVADNSFFKVGDLCYISDSRTEADFMAPEPSRLFSQANMEIYRIVGLNMTGPNTITFERELLRDYLMSFKAGVTKMDPVINSHIIANQKVTWPTPQDSRKVHSFAANYGSGCTIKVANAQGKTGKLGASARIAYSYNCHIYDSNCYDAYRFESAEGYGLTLYYSTFCSIRNCQVAGMRHNYLLQTCTSCDITDNVSSDDYISGIDLHGAASINSRIARNRVGRSRNFAPGVTNGGGIRNGNTAHTLGDHGTIIEENIVEGYNYSNLMDAIDVSPSSQGVIIRGNTIVDCWNGVKHYPVGSQIGVQQVTKLLIVDGNTFTRCQVPTNFQSKSNSVVQEVVFTNNKSINNLKNFELKGIPKVRAYNNQVIAPTQGDGTAYAFEFDTIDDLQAYGNVCGGTDRGIRISSVTAGNVVRNFCQDVRLQQWQTNVINSPNVVLSLNGNEAGGGAGTVKSVQGQTPDAAGNVVLTAVYGDPTIDFMAAYLAAKQ